MVIGWAQPESELVSPEAFLRELTPQQREQFSRDDYVWSKELGGVVWKSPEGLLRCLRFTCGAHFRTRTAEYFINSQGKAHQLGLGPRL